MKSYEVVNRLPSPVSLEDMGIVLQAAGSPGDRQTVSESMHDSSAHLARMVQMKCVRVLPVFHLPRRRIPVWPLSILSPPASVPPEPRPVPAPLPLALPSSMAVLESRLAEIVGLLESRIVSPAQESRQPLVSSDPIFMPSKIVPDAESVISVTSSESESSGFDESARALSKIRKQKK